MRIPLSKVYRAFPELDRFSDAECEGFVRLAKTQFALSSLGTAIIAGMVGILCAALTCFGGYILTGIVHESTSGSLASELMGVATVFIAWIVGAVIGMLWYEQWLRKTILGRLKMLNCASCQYSLLGLEPRDGGIICPECGQRFDLAERGLTPEDLIAAKAAP